jgi:L-ascorbate metabolism protein UlaG (beta-lactamase superfamily)
MLSRSLRRRARTFTQLVRHSAVQRRTGRPRKPLLVEPGQMGLTFIGHSSFFLQIGGQNLVIDPNFARWLFVLKRLRRPGLRIKDLPAIDTVLVTHAHFDHLHRPSLRAIARHSLARSGRAPQIIVPEHVADLVSDLGFRDIFEMTWWAERRDNGLSITAVPANHWGARILRDMHRGYGGYVIRSRQHSLYHAGDTAWFNGFREIGRRLHPEVALLPIGAYDPPAYRNNHTNPEDAVRAFVDLGSRWMVPMHYGSFRLSHEPIDEPLRFLQSEARAAAIEDRLLVLTEGMTKVF